jgi:hypothetical protein
MGEPRDWKKLHEENVRKLDPAMRDRAAAYLRHKLSPAVIAEVRALIAADPQEWWVPYHFDWMMAIRNALREAGYGEQQLGIDNLDDYAVGLVELAVQEQPSEEAQKETDL